MITGALSALSAGVIWSAYEKKQQFYPTVVYLMNSNRAMGVRIVVAFSPAFHSVHVGAHRCCTCKPS